MDVSGINLENVNLDIQNILSDIKNIFNAEDSGIKIEETRFSSKELENACKIFASGPDK